MSTLALGLTGAFAACGQSADPEPVRVPAVPGPVREVSAPGATSHHIWRLDAIKHGFPDGFTVGSHPAKRLDQHDIDNSGLQAFSAARVHPAQCRALLLPAHASPAVGTLATALHAKGARGAMYVIAMRLPQPAPATDPPAGCQQMWVSGAPEVTGRASPIPAPRIAGVATTGARLQVTENSDPDYVFTAALDERTCVVVVGAAAAELDPQRLLAELLISAVTAIRRR